MSLTPRADVAKCDGLFFYDGQDRDCPLRDKCMRYLRPSAPKGQVWGVSRPEYLGRIGGWWCFDQIKTERTNG